MLDLSPETETILEREAARKGVSVDSLIRGMLAPRPSAPDQKALNLINAIRTWQAEDITNDQDELDQRDRARSEHHRNLDHARQQDKMRPLFPK